MAKILIVDDVETDSQLMASHLREEGYACVTANNGDEGLEKAKKEKPDLILLDIVMPKQDGYQTCRKIKKDPETKGIPVVMVSSKNQDSDRFWAEKQGASGYITKPFTKDSLVKAVRNHC
jgi:twitching motility two-component system response regulator PilH